MVGFSHFVLQQALYERLTSNAPLMAMVSGVFDRVPDDTSFPYITLGDMAISDASALGTVGTDQRVDLHVWSREGGRKQAAAIMDSVYGLLHNANFSVTGQALVNARFSSSTIQLENDGWTYHGKMQFRVILQAS